MLLSALELKGVECRVYTIFREIKGWLTVNLAARFLEWPE